MFYKKSKELVGIDIGSSFIKVIKLKQINNKYSLVNIGIYKQSSTAISENTIMSFSEIADNISKLFKSLDIKDTNIASAINGTNTIVRKIIVPYTNEEEIEEKINWEAEQYIPFDIKDIYIDYHIIGLDPDDSSRAQILLVAAKKDIVADYISIFNELKFKLEVLDMSMFSTQNAFEKFHDDYSNDKCYAIVNIGANTCALNIIKNGISHYTKDMSYKSENFQYELQKEMQKTSEEANNIKLILNKDTPDEYRYFLERHNTLFVKELKTNINHFDSTMAYLGGVEEIILTGGGSRLYKLRKTIEEQLEIKTVLFNPFKTITVDENIFDKKYIENISPFFSVALGLAIKTK